MSNFCSTKEPSLLSYLQSNNLQDIDHRSSIMEHRPAINVDGEDPMSRAEWLRHNRFHHSSFVMEELAAIVEDQALAITVIIPARNVADTIGNVLDTTVKPLVDAKIVSSVVAVVTCDLSDQTAKVAAAHGARLVRRQAIAPELGPSLGKGDAMWRALQDTTGDIVAFLDGDTEDPSAAHLLGIIAPLILRPEIRMVRGCFSRPFKTSSGEIKANEGGRVTELCARPLLNLYVPELAGFLQPLAGEFAARRDLLEALEFPVGFGVEIATLIDTFDRGGLKVLAETDIGSRQNQHKPLRDLTSMSFTIMCAVEKRIGHNERGTEKLYLPWDDKAINVSAVERPSILGYRRAMRTQFGASRKHLPFIPVEGVINFRDVGAALMQSHPKILRGMIYRSADLGQVSEKGQALLRLLGIGAIFDTRSSGEVEQAAQTDGKGKDGQYTAWLSGEQGPLYFHVPILEESSFMDPVNVVYFDDYARPKPEGFAQAYMQLVKQSGPCMTTILHQLADNPHLPILIHSTAGKDRTGIVVMLLLLLAGCEPQAIAAEYAMTEMGLVPWPSDAYNRLSRSSGLEQYPEICHYMTSAKESSMLATIRAFQREWPNVKEWALSQTEVQSDVLERAIRAIRYTE